MYFKRAQINIWLNLRRSVPLNPTHFTSLRCYVKGRHQRRVPERRRAGTTTGHRNVVTATHARRPQRRGRCFRSSARRDWSDTRRRHDYGGIAVPL